MCWTRRETTANVSATLSKVSILVGLICALSYFAAFVGTGWVYTKEPYKLTNLNLYTSVTFKIGLWRACHSFKRINSTITLPTSKCTFISYTNWNHLTFQYLTTRSNIESTTNVINKLRWCALFAGSGFLLLMIGFIFCVVGHMNGDSKTLLASVVYTLSGLSLATGLFILVCSLTDSFAAVDDAAAWWQNEQKENQDIWETRKSHNYKYGWCFLIASISCILAELAALLCITVHQKRCRTTVQIIQHTVPIKEKSSPADDDNIRSSSSEARLANANEVPVRSETPPPDICFAFLNVKQPKRHVETDSLTTRRVNNYATLNTKNYRRLNYSTDVGGKYSISGGCADSLQGNMAQVPTSSLSTSSTQNIGLKSCRQSASNRIQRATPKVREVGLAPMSTATCTVAIATDLENVENGTRTEYRAHSHGQPSTLDDFGL